MPDVDVHWQVDAAASCFHAVECLLLDRPVVDDALAGALQPLAERLTQIIEESRLPTTTFMAHLVPLSVQIGTNRQLANVVLTKTMGSRKTDDLVARLAEVISELESTFDRIVPSAAAQLADSAAPLRSRWQEYGNLMMTGVACQTEPDVPPASASVVLVHPAGGGGGRAFLLYNMASIEALANDWVPELPEIVRLGWLISQLNADIPMFQGEIHRDRLLNVAPLAMIPVALAAARNLDLSRFDEATLRRAVEAWLPEVAQPAVAADSLWRWWETYTSRKPRWSVALAALDRMLAE